MERKDTNQLLKPAKIGAILLGAAVIIGVLVMLLSSPRRVKVETTPEPTAKPVVSAAPTPTPAPELTAIRLYAYGRELNADGITLYVGDKPVEIYAERNKKKEKVLNEILRISNQAIEINFSNT